MTDHRIRLTRDWTDPEGKPHKKGDIVVVPDAWLRMENDNGLTGGYTTKLEAPRAPAQQKPDTTKTTDKE